MNKNYFFSINISYQSYQSHYSGSANKVLVVTECGLKIQLPTSRFRPFITHSGIKGRFQLTTDRDNRFLQLLLLG
ncbi:MAG: DUF2835 domain-containing protein [Aliivibrio sp.]|uniref:DUF2835 domain-containing protein n=1 Tax=Aliivibrio sp. TaxID=1872443 RepID=UPI001A5D8641|nr:DUF2835 domain-containing protein [Aliivibrio sp.]